MDTNKITVKEETLNKACRMLCCLRHHYLRKAREVVLSNNPERAHMAAKYEAKAAEVDEVLDAIDDLMMD